MDILVKSQNLILWIESQVQDLKIPVEDRQRLVAGCYDITLEHQKAITLLVSESLFGSAFALAKSVFESFIRGVWLQYCATDTEVTHFLKGKFDLSMGQMIAKIEELEGYGGKVLTAMKQSGWASLNQYSHSGILQVARQADTRSGKSGYTPEEVKELLDFVNNIAILAAMELALLSGKQDIDIYLDKITEYHHAPA